MPSSSMDPIVGMEDEDPGIRLEVSGLRGACSVRNGVHSFAASKLIRVTAFHLGGRVFFDWACTEQLGAMVRPSRVVISVRDAHGKRGSRHVLSDTDPQNLCMCVCCFPRLLKETARSMLWLRPCSGLCSPSFHHSKTLCSATTR